MKRKIKVRIPFALNQKAGPFKAKRKYSRAKAKKDLGKEFRSEF